MAILQPEGLTYGHVECRSFDDTLPVFTDLLACDIVSRADGAVAVKHPNTDWTLVLHEAGEEAPDKPRGNHYGFRVADHKEIEAAWDYISQRRDAYQLRSLGEPQASHFAYSIYLEEAGGNTIELEYYNVKAADHGRQVAAGHWDSLLPVERFPGRGYVPQALSHGTAECDDQATSNAFYTEVLGLDIMGGGRVSTYIGHHSTPWYVVVLPAGVNRTHLRPVNRYTLKVASPSDVATAHGKMAKLDSGLTHLGNLHEERGEAWFVLSDLDHNWWEVTSSPEPNPSTTG